MTNSMTQPFAVAFLKTCFEEGLTEAAASELLQKESSDRVIRKRGLAFAEGYKQAADKVPGKLLPMITEGSMRKEAAGGLLRAVSNLRSLWGGFGAKVSMPFRKSLDAIKSRPRTTAGVVVGGAGAGLHNYYSARDQNLMGGPLGEGKYDAAAEAESYNRNLYAGAQPILDNNKIFNRDTARLAELQDAVDSGAPGSGFALREIREIESRQESAQEERDVFTEQFDEDEKKFTGRLGDIEGRQEGIRKSRDSFWNAPLERSWLALRGEGSDDFYNDKLGRLQRERGEANANLRRVSDTRSLLDRGVTSHIDRKPTTARNIQQEFFPTY